MQFTQHESHIQQYDNHQITINDFTYEQSILVTPLNVIASWPITDVNQLQISHLTQLMEQHPEIVIIGTGEHQKFPNSTIQRFFVEQNMAIEVMSTGAACRTFNILLAENRHVCAILIISQGRSHGTTTT